MLCRQAGGPPQRGARDLAGEGRAMRQRLLRGGCILLGVSLVVSLSLLGLSPVPAATAVSVCGITTQNPASNTDVGTTVSISSYSPGAGSNQVLVVGVSQSNLT